MYLNGRQLFSIFLVTVGLILGSFCRWLAGPLVSGQMVLPTRVVIWSIQLFSILIGIFLFRANSVQQRRRLAYSIILVILMVLFVEATLQIVFFAANQIHPVKIENAWYLQPPYRGQDWARMLYEETNQTQIGIRYNQFLQWERVDVHGRYVNIDSQGVRKTWNAEPIPDQPMKTIWLFGGSTAFGYGARDEYTIPSYLSRFLSQHDRYCWHVENYGQAAYDFSQGVLKLILLLREGRRPDYVVMYDGINDVYGAYQSGKAGLWHNTEKTRTKIEQQWTPVQNLILGLKGCLRQYCRIYQVIGKIGASGTGRPFPEPAAAFSDDRLQTLAEDTGRCYLNTFHLLDRLSKAYGFEFVCFLQPVIFLEKQIAEDVSDPAFRRVQDVPQRKLFELTYAFLDSHAPGELVNIADSLSYRTSPVYIDPYHISEPGNEAIARRIFETFVCRFLPGATVPLPKTPGLSAPDETSK